VYSHLTALRIEDLSDANPSRLDLTVPPDFRRNSSVPPVLVLHKAMLYPDEILRKHGYTMTTPMRAVVGLAVSGKRIATSSSKRSGKASAAVLSPKSR
jgi:hypothetical protein